jgi:hypothetical protein
VPDHHPAAHVWRRSTKSVYGSCVEVRFVGEDVHLRNSRDPEGPILVFTPAEWDAFLAGAEEHEFDRPT